MADTRHSMVDVAWPSSCAGLLGYHPHCMCTTPTESFFVPPAVRTMPANAFNGCQTLRTITGMAGVTEATTPSSTVVSAVSRGPQVRLRFRQGHSKTVTA